jgi:ribonuclease HI
MSYLTVTPRTLYFDGSVCNEGQGIDIVLVSPSSASFDFSNRLKTYCTNNQAKYEALLFGLELINCMGLKHVKTSDDSQLVVQKILEEYQCLYGTLNSYLVKYWSIIHSFDEFNIRHTSRVENYRANNLAQDASGYQIKRGKFHNTENLITGVAPDTQIADRPGCQAEPAAAGSERLGLEYGPSDVARKVLLIDSADNEADAIKDTYN